MIRRLATAFTSPTWRSISWLESRQSDVTVIYSTSPTLPGALPGAQRARLSEPLLPSPSAPCPLPSALCLLPSALCLLAPPPSGPPWKVADGGSLKKLPLEKKIWAGEGYA